MKEIIIQFWQFLRPLIPSMENFIDILDVLIWPFVVFFIIWKFKKPIESLLPYVENIRYGDLEIKIRQGLSQIKEEVREAGTVLEIEEETTPEINKLVEISPTSAILEAWKELEFAARKKVEELAPKDQNFRNILQRPVSYLEYTRALIPSTARAIRELQHLRNQAAHNPDLKITKETALDYISLAKSIEKQVGAITELPAISLTALTYLIIQINSLVDSGDYIYITIDDVNNAIKKKRILSFLKEKADGDIDLSIYGPEGSFEKFVEYYHDRMYAICIAYEGDERRKWGVEKQGLCLLVAWTNEIIQQGSGWQPNE